MAIKFSRSRITYIAVVLFFIYGCDDSEDPYKDTNCLENLQLLSNSDTLPQVEEEIYKYLYYDTVTIGSTVSYTYSSKYISECSEQVKYNKEFGDLTHNAVENTIQFSPIKPGITDIEITVTDPWSKIYDIRLALTINNIVLNQIPIMLADVEILDDILIIDPTKSYDPDGEIVCYNYWIEGCDHNITTKDVSIITIDLGLICKQHFLIYIRAQDNNGDWSEVKGYSF